MHIQRLIEGLDGLLRYQAYPDLIINLLQVCDPASGQRYEAAYLEKTSGLLLRCGAEISRLYTAAFPSDDLIAQLHRRAASDALLIVKHPMDWEELGRGFVPISAALEQELRERRVSVYCAHAAHDNFEIASPGRVFATALGLVPQRTLRDERGRIFGYVADLEQPLAYGELRSQISAAFDLPQMQERYAHDCIRRVAVVAGGGDNVAWLQTAQELGCDTYVTGILYFRGSAYAQQHNPGFIEALHSTALNAFGVSHYLSERQGSVTLAQVVAQHCGMDTVFLEETQKEALIRAQWGLIL